MQTVLDNVILRFPHLAEDIFNELDTKSLENCTIVSKLWKIFIAKQKFAWIRSIQNHTSMHGSDFFSHWKKIVVKTPTDIIKQMVLAIQWCAIENHQDPIYVVK